MPQTITIRVPQKGLSKNESKVHVETDGFVGTNCRTATEQLEKLFGGMQEETIKPEMYAEGHACEFVSQQSPPPG